MPHRLLLPLVILLLAACAGTGSGITGKTERQSTEDFDVDIVQSNTPMVMQGHTEADVRFDLTVRNRTDRPYTIRRVALQSLGSGVYRIRTGTRQYELELAPGAEAKIEYWARTEVGDATVGARAPLVVRATLDMVGGDGSEREETFTSRVNGRVTVGTTTR